MSNLKAGQQGWSLRTPSEPAPGACCCQDAVRTLNTLQTNASYLEQVKRQRGDPQAQLEAMKLFLARSGLQVKRAGPVSTPPPIFLGEPCC